MEWYKKKKVEEGGLGKEKGKGDGNRQRKRKGLGKGRCSQLGNLYTSPRSQMGQMGVNFIWEL